MGRIENSPLGLVVGKYFQDGRFCGTDSVSVGGMNNLKKNQYSPKRQKTVTKIWDSKMPKGAIVQKCKKNKPKMCMGLGYCKKN